MKNLFSIHKKYTHSTLIFFSLLFINTASLESEERVIDISEKKVTVHSLALGTDVDNEDLFNDVLRSYKYLSSRLGEKSVVCSLRITGDVGKNSKSKTPKGVLDASEKSLEQIIIKLGKDSQPGDIVFLNLDGHGDMEDGQKPLENTIEFDDDSMTYEVFTKLIKKHLPKRKIKIINHLCHGGGNHQLAFLLPNVIVASGSNQHFGKSNPGDGDQFGIGFYSALQNNPNISFSEAVWLAKVNDAHNSDHAGISSDVYLEYVLKRGDYSPSTAKVDKYIESSMAEINALLDTISKIEKLNKESKLVNFDDMLPTQIAKMKDHLIHKQIKWLKSVIGTKKWNESKVKYSNDLKKLKKSLEKKGKKRRKKEKSLCKDNESFEDYRVDLEEDAYTLILANGITTKIAHLQALFADKSLINEQIKYLQLIKLESESVFPTQKK